MVTVSQFGFGIGSWLLLAVLATISPTVVADCGSCHILAYCDNSTCVCQPGTIDESAGTGMLCNKNGFTVRYVVETDPGENPTATLSWTDAMAKCAPSAQGYFVRSVDGAEEVNCIYSVANTPSDLLEYGDRSPGSNLTYSVRPAIYKWTLPTTASPLEIPPTGMTVDSVHFKPSCAETGCWVIKGVVTTGEAFNTFGAFNTFYLPQTNLNWQDSQACDAAFSRNGVPTCWHSLEGKMSYPDAVAQCAAQYNGIPVTIHTAYENALLADTIAELSLGSTWIGLTDIAVENNFTWIDNSTVDFEHWPNHEPNDWGSGEDCVEIRTNGWWNDLPCRRALSVVCEISAPDEYPLPGGHLSYDYDYFASEWTYLPAQHPCTSVDYDAGEDDTDKISTCCITNPKVGPAGGFVANYRPTQQFVDWSGELMCDLSFYRGGGGNGSNASDASVPEQICWKYYAQHVQFEVAKDRCAAAGGKVAEIHSEIENVMLFHYMLGKEITHDVWVALGDSANESIFVLPDGSPAPYTNWARGEPNDYNDDEDCTEVRSNGEWNDIFCTHSNHYICEFEPPVFDRACVEHVIQRPELTKPVGDTPCWNTFTTPLTFADAQADCASRNGSLATIEDDEENWFYRRLLVFKGLTTPWIGITDLDTEGNFTWVDGSETTFTNWATNEPNDLRGEDCTQMYSNGLWNDISCSRTYGYICELPRTDPDMVCDSDELENLDPEFDIVFPSDRVSFLHKGPFKGMTASPGIVEISNLDPFFGQFAFEIQLDEVELRSKAGMLRGTVGVEHSVDTFLGLANFRPTGIKILDTFAIQTNLHLEKTDFFTVSTYGTNDYTFLEYVNMRLVSIYLEDSDFSGMDESAARTVRTDARRAAHYVQVTFTLGSQYEVNTNSGLVPLDSVRAGEGTFFDTATLDHKCLEWTNAPGYSFSEYAVFDSRLGQQCAPAASMCVSPMTIPDSFVSFNVPLGIDFYDPPSDTLSNNVFVDMVISAVDTTATETPNDGDEPMQMKTTLSASIPVVGGGINIFCDGFTAKTDLKDVANADIVVGSASSAQELSRLRIKQDIASTQLDTSAITRIDSDSIEAGLMTLVLKGNESYFESNTGRAEVTLELEDVITIHIMEDDGNGGTGPKDLEVARLLAMSADDNSDNVTGIDTDGYALNGAFFFTIDRSAQRAHLEPSEALLSVCPFNPARPLGGNMPLETCVTRRDVRFRNYPWRTGAKSTAMEICVGGTPGDGITSGTCPSADGTDSVESNFFVSIFGDSDYAKQLAIDYAGVIASAYELNGRYRRAFWINPGYEWTPTQTGGTPIFSVSQKLYLFALITLDEGLSDDEGQALSSPGPSVRRRMLLQSTTDEALQDGQSSLGADSFEFQTSPASMMAQAYQVPVDRVATFNVKLQLTHEEACMTPTELQASIRATLEDHLSQSASAFHTVQVLGLSADRNGVQCTRRSVRKLLSSFSDATAEARVLMVFMEGSAAEISVVKMAGMPGVDSFEPLNVSPKVAVDASTDRAVTSSQSAGDDSTADSSPNIGLYAGVAAAALVAGLLVAVCVMYVRRRSAANVITAVPAVHVYDVENVKADIAISD